MIRLKISKYDEETIKLEAIGGIQHFGFGTFLCELEPNEIECDEFSYNSLISANEKRGLNGMEIWVDNRIAWGDPSHQILMPVSEISCHNGAVEWLKKIKIAG